MRPAPKVTPKLVVAIVEQARIEAAQEAAMRIPRSLVAAVLLAGLIGVGWMVRSSWAQDPPKDLPATQVPPSSPVEAKKPADVLPPEPAQPRRTESPFDLPPPAAASASSPDSPPTSDAVEDPEKAAQAFVDQNKKTAEGQLKSLKSEAERLRARLQKVEAGIRRWESLLAAIEKSEADAKDHGPTSLEPVPSGRRQLRAKVVAEPARNAPSRTPPDDAEPPRVKSNTPPPPVPQ
jgi:type IV secretory pathway VirB10-like protein